MVRSQKSTTLAIIITQAAYLFLFNSKQQCQYLLMFSFIVVKDSKSKTKSYFLKYKYIVYDRHHQVFLKWNQMIKSVAIFFKSPQKIKTSLIQMAPTYSYYWNSTECPKCKRRFWILKSLFFSLLVWYFSSTMWNPGLSKDSWWCIMG